MLLPYLSRFMALLVLVVCLVAGAVAAQDLEVVAGTGEGASVSFTREALEEMDQVEITTSTIWTDGIETFSGVSLRRMFEDLGVTDGTIELTALNDYVIAIPFDELEPDAPILATRKSGAVMSVRDKGPFWVIYPYDQDARFQTETIFARSIWQVARVRHVNRTSQTDDRRERAVHRRGTNTSSSRSTEPRGPDRPRR